jgi:hypothetical protein
VVLALGLGLTACDVAYPEVIVVNKTSEHIQLRNLSFNGCLWNTLLSYGEATSPGRCLPGEDRVHFQKFDAHAYCQEQVDDGTIDGLCNCDGTVGDTDPALINEVPSWFNYQTISTRRVDYGDVIVIEVTLDDMEQDFSVPGPYGH